MAYKPPRIVKPEKTEERKERFLIAFRKWGLKSKALEEADINWTTYKKWLAEDTVFATVIGEMDEENELTTKEELEAVALKRAVSRSDQLMKFLLSKLDPSYRDRSEVEHKGNVQIIYRENLDLDKL